MHDSDEEEEQTALVCDNGTLKNRKFSIFIIHFIREKYYFIEFQPKNGILRKQLGFE